VNLAASTTSIVVRRVQCDGVVFGVEQGEITTVTVFKTVFVDSLYRL